MGTVLHKQPQSVVTFFENHDLRHPGRPIVNDNILACRHTLKHEGYPCVYWQDYFNQDLARPDSPHGIAALVQAHEKSAGGSTSILPLDDHRYIMARGGHGDAPGPIYVLNNRGDSWRGEWVSTPWHHSTFEAVAWWALDDLGRPSDPSVGADDPGQFHAVPRGFAVYARK